MTEPTYRVDVFSPRFSFWFQHQTFESLDDAKSYLLHVMTLHREGRGRIVKQELRESIVFTLEVSDEGEKS